MVKFWLTFLTVMTQGWNKFETHSKYSLRFAYSPIQGKLGNLMLILRRLPL